MYRLAPALWFDFETDRGVITSHFSIPDDLMHVYNRVIQTISRDYDGLDYDDARIKALPILKQVFYLHAKEHYNGTTQEVEYQAK